MISRQSFCLYDFFAPFADRHTSPARANAPARGVDQVHGRLRPLAVRGIGFAPEMIAQFAVMPHIDFPEGKRMTAYLIPLAHVGLIALALWDGLS